MSVQYVAYARLFDVCVQTQRADQVRREVLQVALVVAREYRTGGQTQFQAAVGAVEDQLEGLDETTPRRPAIGARLFARVHVDLPHA